MLLIVGLGNIGKEYEHTRHNVGFDVIDILADKINASFKEDKKLKGFIAKTNVEGNQVILLKPTTYMNLSGEAVKAVMDYYKIDIEDIVVVNDDLDMETSKIRYRESGSAGGHNGLKNIILHTKSENFKRIKIGIGRDKFIPVIDWVLTKPSGDDALKMNDSYIKVSNALIEFIKNNDSKRLASNLAK